MLGDSVLLVILDTKFFLPLWLKKATKPQVRFDRVGFSDGYEKATPTGNFLRHDFVSHLGLLMKGIHCQLASTLPYRIPDNVSGSHCEIGRRPRRDVAQRATPDVTAAPKCLPGRNDDCKRAARNVCFRLEQRFLEGKIVSW